MRLLEQLEVPELQAESKRDRMADRFWAQVKVGKKSECWPWQGTKDKDGYGRFKFEGQAMKAHNVAYKLQTGHKIPKGRFGCHKCDNPTCVNPHHIYPGTYLQNIADKVRRGRQKKGTDYKNAVLNEADVKAIRKLWNNGHGLSNKELSETFGVSPTRIWSVVNGHSWKWVK